MNSRSQRVISTFVLVVECNVGFLCWKISPIPVRSKEPYTPEGDPAKRNPKPLKEPIAVPRDRKALVAGAAATGRAGTRPTRSGFRV